MSPDKPSAPTASLEREEAARYIASLSGELAVLARHADLDLLAYFLDMARREAEDTVKGERRGDRLAARRRDDRARDVGGAAEDGDVS